MLLNFVYPSNVTVFVSFLFTIASFELIDDIDPLFEKALMFEQSPPFQVQWEILGYKSTDFTVNMGFPFIVYVLQPILVLLISCLMKSKNVKCIWIKVFARKRYDEMIWNGFIRTFIETYIMVALCSIINIHAVHRSSFA